MVLFYGVELDSPCSRPLEVQEIASFPGEVQDWTLEQLTRWVHEHGGALGELLRDADTQWAKSLISRVWSAENARAASAERNVADELEVTGKRVHVTTAEVMAARIRVRRLQEAQEPIPPKLWNIATATRRDASPVRLGVADLDIGFLTPEQIEAAKPELSDALLQTIQTVINSLDQP